MFIFLRLISFVFMCGSIWAAPYHICMTQIISHPSLDLIRKGIGDELTDQGLNTTQSFYNPEGQIAAALQIAQTCVGQKPHVIVALATPSAQTMIKALKGQSIPFVFGAVTDPVKAGLLASLSKPVANITGTIDIPDAQTQLNFFKGLNSSLKTIGILYNPSEDNAFQQAKAFSKAAKNMSIDTIMQPVVKLSDISTAMHTLTHKIDAFFIPNDNMLVSGMETIVKTARLMELPVYTSDHESLSRGATAAFANDQYRVGRETGKLVARVLKGEKYIPVQKVEKAEGRVQEKS